MVHSMRNRAGVKSFEGNGVGGTWYWNRYPGAGNLEIPTVFRRTSTGMEMEKDASQPELEACLEHVAIDLI